MSISGFLLGLILITLIVLVRRAKGVDDEDWIEDEFDDDYDDDDYEDDDYDDDVYETESESQSEGNSIPAISETDRKQLAAQAANLGVMQAVPGTEQGASGWYVDVSEEVQYWNVGSDGSWTRVE